MRTGGRYEDAGSGPCTALERRRRKGRKKQGPTAPIPTTVCSLGESRGEPCTQGRGTHGGGGGGASVSQGTRTCPGVQGRVWDTAGGVSAWGGRHSVRPAAVTSGNGGGGGGGTFGVHPHKRARHERARAGLHTGEPGEADRSVQKPAPGCGHGQGGLGQGEMHLCKKSNTGSRAPLARGRPGGGMGWGGQ